MKVTIIPDDSFVSIDTNSTHYPLDLSACNIPQNVHALQWFDTKGWIEFDSSIDPFTPKPLNQEINVLPAWALACISVWEAWTPSIPPIGENQPQTTGTQTA